MRIGYDLNTALRFNRIPDIEKILMSKAEQLLTLVLPLKGRECFTLRIMDFFDRSKLPFKVIIADGSKTEVISNILSHPEKYPNVNYAYKKFPFDANYIDYYRKMVATLTEVETPYVALLDNDCFPVVEGLSESIKFLESNREYSICRGQFIDFKLNPFPSSPENLLHGCSLSIHPDYFDKSHTIWSSFENQDPLERILDWSHCTNITHYSVFRTKILLDSWKFIARNDCCDIFFCEIALALTALANGKSKVIEYPFILRQQNSPESVSKEAIQKRDILDRMFVEKWTKDINQLVSDTAIIASEIYGCEQAKAKIKITLALKNHFADRLYPYLEKRALSKKDGQGDIASSDRKTADSGVDEPIILSSLKDVHPNLIGIIEFLKLEVLEKIR
jgi:glycosyltransferase domain-containing protein